MSQAVAVAPRRESGRAAILRRGTAPAIGVFAAALTLIGAGTPSFWGDEAASVLSARRPLGSLWQELGQVDAVHGAYYLFLHVWIRIAGTSEFAVRLPSALAAGAAVAGVVVLGGMLQNRRVGILAGLLMLALPEVTRVAIEARSYAFSMAAAVWLTVLLVALVRRGERRRRWWALYAVGLALGIYLFLYVGLLIPVHLVAVALLASRGDRMLRTWARAVAVALVLALPIVVAGIAQEHQIAFLGRRDYASVEAVVVRQWFHSVPVAVLAWTLILAGAVLTLRRRAGVPGTQLAALAAVLTWAVLPTAVLLMGNAWVTPMYNFRYTGLSLPAVALAMAIGAERLGDLARGRRGGILTRAVVIALALALALPVFVTQRGPFAKDGGADLRQTAAAVEAIAQPGDAVVFDQTVKPSRRPRLALDLYPARFAGLDDIALLTPYAQRAALWDRVARLDQADRHLAEHRTVVAVEQDGSASTDLLHLERLGFGVITERHVHRTTVYRLERGAP